MTNLPITRVVLYKHGVGYFEREGKVEGEENLTLTFKQNEVSDVLKSLTVLDLDGGYINAVSYDSTKPVEQLLSEISLAIPDQNSLSQLIPQLKGARVTIQNPFHAEGIIIGIDRNETILNGKTVQEIRLSLLTDEGEILSAPLFESNLTLLDETLKRDLEFYLRTLLNSKKKDARTFTFFASGEGERTLRVSYVLAAPVWKATYRLLLNEHEEPKIQGWAVIDNMQDEDWNAVNLSLVSGLPVSFVHDLYTPRYIRRPEVKVQETTGVLPPEIESGRLQAFAAMGGDSETDESYQTDSPKLAKMRPVFASAPKVEQASYAENRSRESSVKTPVRERELGDLFGYDISEPVTIRRNQSALVPIVLKPFSGQNVLLYQKAAREDNPMRCVEFLNTTGLTLEGGPVTVLDQGSYVGEAMLNTLKPKDQTLVAYAVELSVRVMDANRTRYNEVSKVLLQRGNLITQRYQERITTYQIENKGEKSQVLYIDHPRPTEDWKLSEKVPKPKEITDSYWRFELNLPVGSTQFEVIERRLDSHTYTLMNATSEQLAAWIQAKYVDEHTAQQIGEWLRIRSQIADLENQLNQGESERGKIHNEQGRIRGNLNSLGDRASEKELRERFVRTLNQQEDRLEELNKQEASLRSQIEKLRQTLAERLEKIHYETTF